MSDEGVLEVALEVAPFAVNVIPKLKRRHELEMLKRKATLDPKFKRVIMPMRLRSRPMNFTPTSAFAAQASIPAKLSVQQHEAELAFAGTCPLSDMSRAPFVLVGPHPLSFMRARLLPRSHRLQGPR